MIAKINRIENLGLVFSNYTGSSDLPEFKKCNLGYGWNGSGKTTLSRLFDALSGVSMSGLEYEIEDENGNRYTQSTPFPQKIRVFNQDYIQKNVELFKGRTNTITILLGEENKELVESIDEDRKVLNGDPSNPKEFGKVVLLNNCQRDKRQKTNQRGIKFTGIASTIGAAIGGNALRTYRKPQAESEFSSLKTKVLLSDTDLKTNSALIGQKLLEKIGDIVLGKVWIQDSGEVGLKELIEQVVVEAQELLQKTVKSETIKRLTENEDISSWVEEGISLHKKHSSNDCEYCRQPIPVDRLQQLVSHFNDEDSKIKSKLDLLLEKLRKIKTAISSMNLPDKARFYDEKQKSFVVADKEFKSIKQQILDQIDNLSEEIKQKKTKTTESVKLKTTIDLDALNKNLGSINTIISEHNKTTTDFEVVKKQAIDKLKQHYLSTIYDDVVKLDRETKDLGEQIGLLEGEVKEINERIDKSMAQISSTHKACDDLNNKLSTFLGRDELKFVPHTEKQTDENGVESEVVTGYDIMRGDNLATHLSEGEKTAIAFVYFVVHLGDQDFDMNNGIVVVDDPISSLDSNSLFQAFSFLKNAVSDAGQVFIFTHSFDFLKLLINWRRGAGGAGYYMIKNNFLTGSRTATLEIMDKELCEYESEYHYLFKLLKQLRDEQDGSIAKAYPVPNIARKVWDTFLMFSVPNGKSSYKKMDELKTSGFDKQKLDAVYKFTNDQSHITGSGFDPSLVPETQKVVKELFEMMEAIAPSHFKIIDQATN
jgi:wobble nucleotide-excising tRNase